MTAVRRWRRISAGGLLVGAAGIGLLWASGVAFPFVVPPGIIILVLGAAFVLLAPWRWAPGAGVPLGLFVTGGLLLSPTGMDNITGRHGALVATGQMIQQFGVLSAVVAGLVAIRAVRAAPRVGAVVGDGP